MACEHCDQKFDDDTECKLHYEQQHHSLVLTVNKEGRQYFDFEKVEFVNNIVCVVQYQFILHRFVLMMLIASFIIARDVVVVIT